jgi:hypothetical protein
MHYNRARAGQPGGSIKAGTHRGRGPERVMADSEVLRGALEWLQVRWATGRPASLGWALVISAPGAPSAVRRLERHLERRAGAAPGQLEHWAAAHGPQAVAALLTACVHGL